MADREQAARPPRGVPGSAADAREPAPWPWPATAPAPLFGVLRAQPQDFQVSEELDIALAGSGEHVWLRIAKRALNSDQAARWLARTAGVPRVDVGYAGMKDRHALAVQWFSVRLAGRREPDWRAVLPPGLEILESARHTRKLQVGAAARNVFAITVRDCHGAPGALSARLAAIERRGVPNYFGEQRFGCGGANLGRARAMFAATQPVRDRHLRGIYLSAARAFLFNEVLGARVAAGDWERGLAGDAFVLHGTRSFFVVDAVDDTIAARIASGDIHPSGPLWGAGEPPTRAAVRALEARLAARHPELSGGLAAARLRHERRALRLMPSALSVRWLDATTLTLGFALPAGSYATALLRELIAYRVADPRPQPGTA